MDLKDTKLEDLLLAVLNDESIQNLNMTRLQRHLFIMSKCLKRSDIKYSIYQYGPYCFDLESTLENLLSNRLITRRGAFYKALESSEIVESALLASTLERIGKLTDSELELICNLLYFDSDKESDSIEKAKEIMPKSNYSNDQMKEAYLKAKELCAC